MKKKYKYIVFIGLFLAIVFIIVSCNSNSFSNPDKVIKVDSEKIESDNKTPWMDIIDLLPESFPVIQVNQLNKVYSARKIFDETVIVWLSVHQDVQNDVISQIEKEILCSFIDYLSDSNNIVKRTDNVIIGKDIVTHITVAYTKSTKQLSIMIGPKINYE